MHHVLKRAMGNRFNKYFFVIIIAIFSFRSSYSQINNGDSSVSFKVYGKCVECKERIENSLKMKGVDSANWNVETKMLDRDL